MDFRLVLQYRMVRKAQWDNDLGLGVNEEAKLLLLLLWLLLSLSWGEGAIVDRIVEVVGEMLIGVGGYLNRRR